MELDTLAAWALRLIGWVALGLLAWRGRGRDRIAVLAFLCVWYGTPLVDHVEVGNLRWGVALLSCGLFVALSYLALTGDRWWLLVATGFQGVAVLSYAAGLLIPDSLMWSGVAVRRATWLELMIICLFGAWECHAARRAVREGRTHATV